MRRTSKPAPLGRSNSLYSAIKNVPRRAFGSFVSGDRKEQVVNKPGQNELPLPDVVFKEGYLFKRGRNTGTGWNRRFFKLEGDVLTYSVHFGTQEKARFVITEGTTVAVTKEFAAHEFCLEIRPPENTEGYDRPLYVSADSQEILTQWYAAFQLVLAEISGESIEVTPMKARFYEGTLFKTPRVANAWEAKHMELENGVIYYFDAKKGQRNLTFKPQKKEIRLKGAQIFLNKTDAKGVPFDGKPFQIKEAGSLRLFNLAAPNDDEYLRWLKAIRAWMKMMAEEQEEEQI